VRQNRRPWYWAAFVWFVDIDTGRRRIVGINRALPAILACKLGTWFRCPHPPHNVTADILEGDCLPDQVQWCRICGAYRRLHDGTPECWWHER
jgi:hypothetical protein